MNMFKKTGGFTLVELIVVIAILAILAGVAVPAYSGYLKKAETAADTQLLGAINTAFASACLENGISHLDVAGAVIKIDANGKIDTTAVARSATAPVFFKSVSFKGNANCDQTKLNAAFARFYAGNENSAFKGIKGRSLMLDTATGMFVDPQNVEKMTVTYGGGEIVLTGSDVENLVNSTFIQAGTLGVDGLLDQVDLVTEFAAGMGGTDVMRTITQSQDFLKMVAKSLGMDPESATMGQDLQAKLDSMAAEVAGEGATAEKIAEEKAKLTANAVVLYAAQNAASMDKTAITSMLTKPTAGADLVTNLKADPNGTMANAALAYGLYTAYAHSTGKEALINNTSDYTNMATYLEDEEFKKYVASDAGQADLDAYLSALNMINSSKDDTDAVVTLMQNGFNDQALKDLMEDALGN